MLTHQFAIFPFDLVAPSSCQSSQAPPEHLDLDLTRTQMREFLMRNGIDKPGWNCETLKTQVLEIKADLSSKAKTKSLLSKTKTKDKGGAPDPKTALAEKERGLRERFLTALGVLKEVMKLPESFPFHDPVDTDLLPIYAQVVKNPMDLGTIKKQIEAGRELGWGNLVYSSEEDVWRDVKLVWSNCRLFNGREDPVYKQSLVLEPAFDALWKLRFGSSEGKKFHICSNKPEIVVRAPEKCVGLRVGVWWPGSYSFFYGKIVAYEKEKHKIDYDDGHQGVVSLLKQRIHWYDDKFEFKYEVSERSG